jgi:Flp pilus assembly protein protease CpaA
MFPIQTISVATALIGTTIAAIWDLKTTEVPDQISYAMIVIALILFGYQSITNRSFTPIVDSIVPGLAFLAFGWFIMYHLGQWGGADALLMASVGFLLPGFPNYGQTIVPYPFTFFYNVFLVGAVYLMLYAVVFAILNKKIFSNFLKDLRTNSKLVSLCFIVLFIVFLVANWYISKIFLMPSNLLIDSVVPLVLSMLLFAIWKFAKAVEKYGFKKRVPISKVKVGDMLLEERKLVGVTEKQLKQIKRSGKRYVWIKEGARFAPAFPLAILFTVLYGDGIFLFVRFLV